MNHRSSLLRFKTIGLAAAGLMATLSLFAQASDPRPNVLLISIDDLRPVLGAYGESQMHTPHIDSLADAGVTFERAYCQYPACGPSRASMMSGIHPARSAKPDAWDIDQFSPGANTLPEHFRNQGYHTVGNGKIFHMRDQAADRSWSEPPFSLVNGKDFNHMTTRDPVASRMVGGRRNRTPFYEMPEVADDAYIDGATADKTIKDMERLSQMDQPFFLACGFVRPHLPFYAPKKYWDLYDRDAIALSPNRDLPLNAPGQLRGSAEIHSYHPGIFEYNSDAFHRAARHGYFASVSYVDVLVGRLLQKLDELGLCDDTIVVIFGDHGFMLGEHNLWAKHNLFDESIRSPLIISAPGLKKGKTTRALAELVDVYPTLLELAGLRAPKSQLTGISLVPWLKNPEAPGKAAVFSHHQGGNGWSIRTNRFQLIQYFNGENVAAEALFDMHTDPLQEVNVAGMEAYRPEIDELRAMLKEHLSGIE